MAVRVVSNGKGETHVVATHYVIDPHGVLHLYAADTNVASYRTWDAAYLGLGDGTPPAEPVSDAMPTPEPTPTLTLTADDGSVAALAVESVTLNGPKKRRPKISGLSVPRGGFGSETA